MSKKHFFATAVWKFVIHRQKYDFGEKVSCACLVLKSGVTPGPSEKKISLAVVGIKYQIYDTGLDAPHHEEPDEDDGHRCSCLKCECMRASIAAFAACTAFAIGLPGSMVHTS